MPQPLSAVDEFFGGLNKDDVQKQDVFDEKPEAIIPEKETPEEDGDVRKNRKHRRLEEQLQRERDSNIAMAERIKILSETTNRQAPITEDGLDPRLARIFGTTDEGKEIARGFGEILSERDKRIREETLRDVENQKVQERQEQVKYESMIDSKLEDIEEEYGVDLTSNSPSARKSRRELLEKVQKLSPKDEDGQIVAYADFDATWEEMQKDREAPQATRQKEIASRSMQRSVAGEAPKQITPGFDGWRKDLGI